jgi:hypothetical protein
MEFLEMNLKLTKYFELKIEMNSLHIAVTESIDLDVPCSLTRENDDIFMTIFIPKTINYEKLIPFFPILNVEERQLYYMIRRKIVDENIVNFIRKLDDIDGLVLPYININGRWLVLRGFMHEKSTMAFSDLLSDYLPRNGMIAKVSLKPSEGSLEYMDKWHIKLKTIVVSLPMSAFGHYRVISMLKNTGAIGQFVDNYPREGQFRLLIFSDRDGKEFDTMVELSKDEHIYYTKTDEDILNILSEKAMNKNIAWNFLFMYADENKLYLKFILPEFRAREYLNLIVDTEMELKKMDWVTLEYYGDAIDPNRAKLLLYR